MTILNYEHVQGDINVTEVEIEIDREQFQGKPAGYVQCYVGQVAAEAIAKAVIPNLQFKTEVDEYTNREVWRVRTMFVPPPYHDAIHKREEVAQDRGQRLQREKTVRQWRQLPEQVKLDLLEGLAKHVGRHANVEVAFATMPDAFYDMCEGLLPAGPGTPSQRFMRWLLLDETVERRA